MSKLGVVEVAISGLGLVAAYMIFTSGKKNKNTIFDPTDGMDPNYPGGKKIDATQKVDTHDTFRPSCQVFDQDSQLFVNAGNKLWDAQPSGCFANNDVSRKPRYVDADGNISFKESDPLYEKNSEKGKCFFFDGVNTFLSYPDYDGVTPVNRSKRLCFAAGQTYNDAGRYFIRDSDKQYTLNPEIPWEIEMSEENPNGAGIYDTVVGDTKAYSANGDQCQFNVMLTSSKGTVPPANAWMRTTKSGAFDGSVSNCTANNGRYWQASTQTIIYKNKMNGQLVTTAMLTKN